MIIDGVEYVNKADVAKMIASAISEIKYDELKTESARVERALSARIAELSSELGVLAGKVGDDNKKTTFKITESEKLITSSALESKSLIKSCEKALQEQIASLSNAFDDKINAVNKEFDRKLDGVQRVVVENCANEIKAKSAEISKQAAVVALTKLTNAMES